MTPDQSSRMFAALTDAPSPPSAADELHAERLGWFGCLIAEFERLRPLDISGVTVGVDPTATDEMLRECRALYADLVARSSVPVR